MFSLPASASVDRFVPKAKFYERNKITADIEREFTQLINKITLSYKLAESTLNIPATDNVNEILIFHIELKQRQLPIKALTFIDKSIPYPILFVITYNESKCYVMQHKLDSSKCYYRTEWDQLPELSFTGTSLECVYERIITSFIAAVYNPADEGLSFKDIVTNNTKRQQLEKEIAALESKMRSERQFSKKVEINGLLRQKIQQLEELAL